LTYPTAETVELFRHILEKDGMESIFENLFKDKKNFKMLPMLAMLKRTLADLLEDDLHEEASGFSSGFVMALDIFRRQIEAEFITLEDVELQINNLIGWISYLENENMDLKARLNEN